MKRVSRLLLGAISRSRWTGASILVMLSLDATAREAWAQRAARFPNEDGGWLQWVIGVLLLLVVCAAAFLNSKRSHMT